MILIVEVSLDLHLKLEQGLDNVGRHERSEARQTKP
jgi:hypothetical protein